MAPLATADAFVGVPMRPRLAMKRCIMPFCCGLTLNRAPVEPGTNICGVDIARANFIGGFVLLFTFAACPAPFCNVCERTYLGTMRGLDDWPLIGLDDDDIPESSDIADTLSLLSLSIFNAARCSSVLAPALVLLLAKPLLKLVSRIFFSRSSRSRRSTSLISA